MYIDTHCHLDAAEFDADRDEVAARARAAGVEIMVIAGVERAGFDALLSVCRRTPGCIPALGIHPMYVDNAKVEDLDVLREMIAQYSPMAIGEIGLDFFVPGYDRERQEFYFVGQLKIAAECGLPVLLHIRRAQDAVLKFLRQAKVKGGIAHAFNGSRQQADEFIRLGFKLGFGGAMTYDRATKLRELAATLPLDSIVLETDAPDMPPAFIGKARNSPENLPRIAAVLAELRGIGVEEVAEITTANARAVLGEMA
ncbi:MAG: TatD family hydrolase [Betaproteobacteria bacterium]|nr:TatD family hydrolase [Betaproteobacteria bacterium]